MHHWKDARPRIDVIFKGLLVHELRLLAKKYKDVDKCAPFKIAMIKFIYHTSPSTCSIRSW